MAKAPDYLTRRFLPIFGTGLRNRGSDYFRQDAVFLEATDDPMRVAAKVRGARDYFVALRADPPRLVVSCTCPFFLDNEACKHIWAAMLAAEHAGLLGGGEHLFTELYEDWELELPEIRRYSQPLRVQAPARPPGPKAPPPPPPWRQRLAPVLGPAARPAGPAEEPWPASREVLYVLDASTSLSKRHLAIEVCVRDRKQNGEWGKPKQWRLQRRQIPRMPEESDRAILLRLAGARMGEAWATDYDYYGGASTYFHIDQPLSGEMLPVIAATGRLFLRRGADRNEAFTPLSWSAGEPWKLAAALRPASQGAPGWELTGRLVRGEEEMAVTRPVLFLPGFLFGIDFVAALDQETSLEWVETLRRQGTIQIPEGEQEDLFLEVMAHPGSPSLEVPESLRYERVELTPKPSARIEREQIPYSSQDRLFLALSFDYGGTVIHHEEPAAAIVDRAARRMIVRNRACEDAAGDRLAQAGLKPHGRDHWHKHEGWVFPPARLPKLVRELVSEGWTVEAEGKLVRSGGVFNIEVVSGIDWFDLEGGADFAGGARASLPELLRAARRGESMVRLDDGSYGMLPEDWLRRFGSVLHMGQPEGENLRFRRSQAGILDALLAAQPDIRFDEQFGHMRQQLQRFNGIRPAAQPPGFRGQLRGYQLEGLGWLEFLREFSLGGCLADDMGVGKTAQVLALLETRRVEGAGPSLVVVPKSLVFNWQQEAARFTPELRILEHTGLGRSRAAFAEHHVILTTYGTLRRDVVDFQDLEFDYVVLDEATAIKNAGSESAKAVRLLKARHRLAMSGTPVENHLGELWSLFEFLNPGMLGASSVLQLTGSSLRNPSDETRRILAQALRPYILRRTKDQVAKELPPKVEQTLYCELEPEQRRLYQELLTHYRARLLGKIDKEGIAKSKMQVLEALLRLRQVACHPALVDKKSTGAPSAKLDLLRMQLDEVLAENHKALVFSQFTSFLAILRQQLDADGVRYAYLDGDTRDREAVVRTFQEDPECKLFLISLKAGGLGLNLTAAEYVFLLDPWWNPAVEAQAIDRAHRIGQQQRVFAYRLIARDTVEEKVLKLQESKRDLADAILTADNSLVRGLKREDVEMLLS